MRIRTIVIFLFSILIISSCQSKYHLHFYKIDEQSRQELVPENCSYLANYRIASPLTSTIIAPGRGNLLITNQSGIDPRQKELTVDFFKTESKINYRLYANLPEIIQKDSLNMAGNSICWIIGNYDLPDSLKIYQCREGYLLIDSVKSQKFFAALHAKYFNISGDSLIFFGAMRPKKQQ
jgi:hypothetical protein